jgi:biopolymer transport protein ExbD
MGVSLHGKGLKQPDLNLTPFLDFLSCILAFLMMTAVWAGTAAIPFEPSVGEGEAGERPPVLTVQLLGDRVEIYRKPGEKQQLPSTNGSFDQDALRAILAKDRADFPQETEVVVQVTDGVSYGETIGVIDSARLYGYTSPQLVGNP